MRGIWEEVYKQPRPVFLSAHYPLLFGRTLRSVCLKHSAHLWHSEGSTWKHYFENTGTGEKTKTSQMIQCSIHSKQILLHRSIPGRESDLGRIIGLTSVGPFFMQKRGCWFEVKTFQKVGSRGSLSLPRIKSSSVGQRRSLED